MGLFDNLKRNKKELNLIHVKNLILMASADTKIADAEMSVITSILMRMNINEDTFSRAFNELRDERLIVVVNGRISHSWDVSDKLVAVPAETFDEKLLYLQDYVLLMMSDGTIDEREKGLCLVMAKKMGLPSSSVDALITFISNKTNGYGTAATSQPVTNNSYVSSKAHSHYRLVKEQVSYISENFKKLSGLGIVEAKILCTQLLLHSLANPGDDFVQDILDILQSDIEYCINNKTERIHFINNRLNFYYDEIHKFLDPTYSCIAIYNCLYVNPLTAHPYDIDEIGPDVLDLLSLYNTICDILVTMDNELANLGQ